MTDDVASIKREIAALERRQAAHEKAWPNVEKAMADVDLAYARYRGRLDEGRIFRAPITGKKKAGALVFDAQKRPVNLPPVSAGSV